MSSSNPYSSSSSDDFFWENGDSPAKESATLKPTTTRASKPPPPPPPGRNKMHADTPAVTSGMKTMNTRPTSSRQAASKPVSTTMPGSTATGAKTTNARPLPTAKAAPTMARPVTSYYGQNTGSSNSDQPSTHLTTSSSATSNSGNFYSGTNDNAATSSPMDWSQPAAATTGANDWSSQNAAGNSSQTTSDWYTSGDSSGANGYTNAGFSAPTQQQSTQQPQQPTAMNPYANSQQQLQQPTGANYNYAGSTFMQGAMDAATTIMQPQQYDMNQQPRIDEDDYANEPPLLEELGINLEHILLKTKAVILPLARFGGDQLDPHVICKDADLAGPVAFCLLLGAEMVLTGKLQFGYIYGFGLFGCLSMTLVLNLMSRTDAISFWTVTSILGYSLLPVNVLALLKIFVMNIINLQTLGRLLGLVAVAWSTTAATRLLELGCGLRDQRYLVAYPLALLYSAFVLITIF